VKLGEFFTLTELTTTNTGLPNTPNTQDIVNLTRLVVFVLDPLRVDVGKLIVSSAYRSPLVNDAVGGSETSYHKRGLAADIQSPLMPIKQLWAAIRSSDNRHIDKAILEILGGKEWIHIQTQPVGGNNRNQFFKAYDDAGETAYRQV